MLSDCENLTFLEVSAIQSAKYGLYGRSYIECANKILHIFAKSARDDEFTAHRYDVV